ncbi:hypothetical protein GQ44DRAFT_99446 [Phaeosphaeriaceae sp. PMI808]|nr:hypothetical protein GQ44DRAFT_99446 [Phaeosphaeriaceae sp. PMI808]
MHTIIRLQPHAPYHTSPLGLSSRIFSLQPFPATRTTYIRFSRPLPPNPPLPRLPQCHNLIFLPMTRRANPPSFRFPLCPCLFILSLQIIKNKLMIKMIDSVFFIVVCRQPPLFCLFSCCASGGPEDCHIGVTAREKRPQGRSIMSICNLEYKAKERRLILRGGKWFYTNFARCHVHTHVACLQHGYISPEL